MLTIILITPPSPWRDGIGDFLSAHGLTVRCGASEPEAEALLDSCPVDIAVVDIRQPGSNGAPLIQRLRGRHRDLGIIALTGSHTTAGAVELLEAGADMHSPGNLDPRVLLATVGSLARRLGAPGSITAR